MLLFTILKQFAEKTEWTLLCGSLASRLMAVGNTLAATLCYICAGDIDKTVGIWSRKLNSEEEGGSYVDLLQVSLILMRFQKCLFSRIVYSV